MAALTQAGRDGDFAALLEKDDHVVREAVATLLRDAARRDLIDRTLDPAVAARWVCSLMDTLYFIAADGGFDADLEVPMLRTIVLRFLRADDGGRSSRPRSSRSTITAASSAQPAATANAQR